MSKKFLKESAALRLISDDQFDEKDFTIISEGVNAAGKKQYVVTGPYIAAELINRNRRKYRRDEVEAEVQRLNEQYITTRGLGGELNHPNSPDIDLERICHKICELKQDGNIWVGKSRVSSTPKGIIMSALIDDGFKIGMSTRALGKLSDEGSHSLVTELRLVTVDAVADPSYGDAFVDGILESKQYICNSNGIYEEVYENFENKLAKLPKKELDLYIRAAVIDFMGKL